MKKTGTGKRIVSVLLAVLMAFTAIMPAMTAFAGDGVVGFYDIELFYKETDTIIPSTMLNDKNEEVTYIEYMHEGDELELTYKLIDTEMPDNGYIKWYSEEPTLVDVRQDGVVKAFDSSKGAVIHAWIDNEVKTIPLVGGVIASALEKVLFNDYVDLDTMDTEAIIDLVEGAFGSDSLLGKYVESYKGELIDSLRYYLDNINSDIHVQLFASDGTLLDDDEVRICVLKSEEWYANFLPNGTHITNKDQINTTVAVGSTVQLYAITTPVRLQYGCVYSVKSSSVFEQGKVVATVDDSGLVTFRNTGTVTIMVSPDTEQIIENILKLVNYFYEINTELIDSKQLADILIKYVGIDMNRNVLAALLDACFIIADIAGDVADPVKLSATAVKIIANLVLQFVYNDSITFNVVDAQPITNFDIEGANTVKEGTQIKLSITNVEPSVGDTSDITWYSSDPNIASVDPKTGVITGRDAGGSLGAISSQKCTIYAVSAANNVTKSYEMTVTGKMGQYISDVDIIGESYLEIGSEANYTYSVYPSRVANSTNLYISWGMVTGEDEEGNITYEWANAEESVNNGIGTIDNKGHYAVVSGGKCQIAVKAQTGYYLSNGNFYEISSAIKTFEITNGIPIEGIQINVTDNTGWGSINKRNTVTINGQDYQYVSVKASAAYYEVGAVVNAQVYPATATNQSLKWVVDNGYYSTKVSGDTHEIEVSQKAGHENADTFNIYATSQDGTVKSNVITVCVSKNNVTSNVINEGNLEVIRGKKLDVSHSIDFDKSSDGTYSACYKCNWYSSDESVFTVATKTNDNRDGRITAVDVGTATLYCVSADGGYVDTRQVTVYPDKDYLRNIVKLCESTVIRRTKDNADQYKKYMNRLDLAYTVLYDFPMASQTTCDTYADELLNLFYRLGGFIGINGVDILDKNGNKANDFITVSVGSVSNYTNYSYQFEYQVKPSTAMYSSVVWSSSNPNVTIDANGKCRPKSNDPCAAIITCTVSDYMGAETSSSVFIAFSRTAATGISLDKSYIDGGRIGETEKITATVKPTGTIGIGGASNTAVYWSSSDDEIASVDQNGVVTFKEGGDCVITATTYDGGFTAQCGVYVVTNYTALQLLVQQYTDLQLNSVNYYPDSWEVFDTAMTKARQMIAFGKNSQNEVDAMYNELLDAYNNLQKYNYIQKIELYLDGEATQEFYQYDLSLLSEGISYKNAVLDLNVRLYPNNGSYRSVQWASSTTDISVTSDGKCSPTVNKSCYGMITCVVTDHYGNQFQDTVWVSYAYYPVTGLRLSETSIAGEIGTTHPLGCTVEPEGTSLLHVGAASIKDYYWESDNEDIATVDENGMVTFVATGATKVRAVSYDGGFSAECIVSTNGDRTALKNAVDAYANVDYTDYEYSYGMAFKEAYEEAERAMTDVSYTQERIDDATFNLITAYESMISHPYASAESVSISYTTTKDPTFGGQSNVATGTVGNNDAVSINLSRNYADYNSNNWITLTAGALPSGSMYKSITWRNDLNSKCDVTVTNNSVKVKPTDKNAGAWAVLTAIITDDYNRTVSRMIVVTLSDKTCTGFSIAESSKTMLATAPTTAINYTISGSPEFDTVIWTSSNTSVATVDGYGNVTPVEKGTTVITGKTLDGGYSASVTINVQTDFSALANKQSEYYNLIEDVKDSYTYTQASLDALSVLVSEAQTMINEGRATQAEADDMLARMNAAYDALVFYVPALSVNISAEEDDNVSIVKDGYIHYISNLSLNGKQIVLIPELNDAEAVYTQITWTSSSTTITVDETGIVTNNSTLPGSALITCTIKNVFGSTFTDTAYVTFARSAVTGISFKDEMVFGAPAQKITLSPDITGSATAAQPVKTCVYTSSDPSIATVDDKGEVTFISQGVAVITATTVDGGYSATINAYTTWDTTALKAAIDEAKDIKYTDYAYEYGTVFNEAYIRATEVYANVYASQAEIDAACMALTEATTALEGNEFIVPVISVVQGDSVLSTDGLVQVNTDTQKATISLNLNDGAMIKSATMAASEQRNVTTVINGNNITVTKTGADASFVLNVLVVDDYDREYTATYNFSVIDQIIPVTSLVLTANGTEIGSTYVQNSLGATYRKFTGITVGYIPTPSNANAITSVTYTSSDPSRITISNAGVIGITNSGKLRTSNVVTITCTVTSADGTVASASFALTLTQ